MIMWRSRAWNCALLSGCVALLAGCSHTQRVGANRTLNIALSEYRVKPSSATVTSGYIDIHVRNFGRLTHNLVISLGGQTAGATKPIWPGQSAELTLSLPPGTYSMASTMLSDEALGAYGTLKVTKG
jgi:hypothetical protein